MWNIKWNTIKPALTLKTSWHWERKPWEASGIPSLDEARAGRGTAAQRPHEHEASTAHISLLFPFGRSLPRGPTLTGRPANRAEVTEREPALQSDRQQPSITQEHWLVHHISPFPNVLPMRGENKAGLKSEEPGHFWHKFYCENTLPVSRID